MTLWKLALRLKYRYTKEQKKVFAGKLEMTEDRFWSCLNTAWGRQDHKRYHWLISTYPQYVKQQQAEYNRRFEEDADFRAAEEAKAERVKGILRAEMGEEWVKEHWRD